MSFGVASIFGWCTLILVAELNAASSNARLRTYLWGIDLSGQAEPAPNGAGGVGGLLLVTDYVGGTTHHWPAYDGNGNVPALVAEANGSLSARYEYGPFGETLRATGPMAKKNPLRFSTKYTDDQTGFLYYGYRFYNPTSGRWLSRDPINEGGHRLLHRGTHHYSAVEEEPNLWRFVGNQPVQEVDALGLKKVRYVPDEIDRLAAGACGLAVFFTSLCERIEFCGQICECARLSGSVLEVTGPVAGRKPTPHEKREGTTGVCNPRSAPCSDGCVPVAYYHSHPHGRGSSHFSPYDRDALNSDWSFWERAYVCTGTQKGMKSLRCLRRGFGEQAYPIPVP